MFSDVIQQFIDQWIEFDSNESEILIKLKSIYVNTRNKIFSEFKRKSFICFVWKKTWTSSQISCWNVN